MLGRLISAGVVVVLWGGLASADAGPARQPGLSVRSAQLTKEGRPYRGVGANYFDLFLRVLHEPTNTSSLRGLEQLGKAGIPFVRFATAYGAADFKVYFEQREEYLRRLDLVVRAAERSKVGLIPSMLWTFELPDLASEHRDQWGNPNSKTLAMMRQYVGDVVARYKDSPPLAGKEFAAYRAKANRQSAGGFGKGGSHAEHTAGIHFR